MLSDAGFSTIKIDTSDKVGLVQDLPPHEIRSYAAQAGTVYWYYDPDVCSCVYEGHQNEFDRYQMATRQQNDTEQYAAESGDQEVASLNALNGMFFPPPLIWVGGFPPGHYIGGGHGGPMAADTMAEGDTEGRRRHTEATTKCMRAVRAPLKPPPMRCVYRCEASGYGLASRHRLK